MPDVGQGGLRWTRAVRGDCWASHALETLTLTNTYSHIFRVCGVDVRTIEEDETLMRPSAPVLRGSP